MISTPTIKRLTLSEQIKEALHEQISSGQLKPGDRLIEMKIAEEMQTSQAPVREALRELEAVGIIEIRRNRGAVIRNIDRDELKEIYAVRAALESLAVTEVASNASHLGIKLTALCDRMEASERMGYSGAFGTLNQEFHAVIVNGSGNATLIEIWEKLNIRTRTAQNLARPDRDLSLALKAHREIAEAVSNGESTHAAALLSAHIMDVV